MIFADHITVDSGGRRATGSLFVDPAADYLRDHFPGAPMLPGLVMLEAAVRVAGALIDGASATRYSTVLEHLERLQIVRRVGPGETLVMTTERAMEEGDGLDFSARGSVGDALAVRARFRLRLTPAGAFRWPTRGSE